MTRQLTDKQERFCQEYLMDLNASAAALRAGYRHPDNGRQLLTKTHVENRIAELKADRSRRTEITADRVLLEYARLAFSEMRQFASWGPTGVTWKDSEELDEAAAACVAEVSETISEGGRTRRFKLHSKTSALSDLAKHLGLFGKDGGGVNVNVNIDNRKASGEEQFEKLFSEIDEYRAQKIDEARGGANPGEPLGAPPPHD
jgi:phage terminase small subunit